jgi:hypothetical protein
MKFEETYFANENRIVWIIEDKEPPLDLLMDLLGCVNSRLYTFVGKVIDSVLGLELPDEKLFFKAKTLLCNGDSNIRGESGKDWICKFVFSIRIDTWVAKVLDPGTIYPRNFSYHISNFRKFNLYKGKDFGAIRDKLLKMRVN